MTGRLIRMPLRPGTEPWLSKKQLAAHLGYSTRWVELRVKDGMPHQRWVVTCASKCRRSSPG
jgi:hypothetical protein